LLSLQAEPREAGGFSCACCSRRRVSGGFGTHRGPYCL